MSGHSITHLQFAGLAGTTRTVSNGPVDDLNIHVVYDPSEHGAWRIEFDANPALYDREFLARLQLRFLRLLAAMDDPAALVGQLDILPPDERRQILVDWNQTAPITHAIGRSMNCSRSRHGARRIVSRWYSSSSG